MKTFALLIAIPLAGFADDAELALNISRHQTGSRDLSDRQDELAADVQQLTIEQTDQNVIDLFREVEDIMDEASEKLWDHDTGGETIAAETEIIEKIYEAAQARQQQQQQQGEQGEAGSAMMDMLGRMMGKEPGGKPSDKGDGEGMTGDSDADNENITGAAEGRVEERRVPKGAGVAGGGLPREFQDALKAYNRGAEPLIR